MMNCEEEKRNLLANCTHCNSIAQQHSTAHSNALPLPAQLIIALIESSHTSAHPPATMLWADKHRPLSLCKLQLHSSVNQRLLRLCSAPRDLPHLLLYGPPGAGKGVRVHCLLRQLFGPAVDRRKVHHKQFKVNTKTIDLSLIGSAHHLELNPSEVGAFNDRHVVQEVIKELASTATVTSALHNNNDTSASNSQQQQSIHYKVVVLTEVDHLSLQAQQALRRTMEQYTATCRLILVCSSLTKVIAPLVLVVSAFDSLLLQRMSLVHYCAKCVRRSICSAAMHCWTDSSISRQAICDAHCSVSKRRVFVQVQQQRCHIVPHQQQRHHRRRVHSLSRH